MTSIIQTQSERTYICIDGVKYPTDRKTVLLCELLMKYQGLNVRYSTIFSHLWGDRKVIRNKRAGANYKTSETISIGTLNQYAFRLRQIVEPCGWVVANNHQRGYVMYFSEGLAKRRAA